MKVKFSYGKLKEIMSKERVDMYLNVGLETLFSLLEKNDLLITYEYKDLNSKLTSSSWKIKNALSIENPNGEHNQIILPVRYVFEEYIKYKKQLKNLEHFGMTDAEMEIDIDLITHFKEIEEYFEKIDEYFLEKIGDVKDLIKEEKEC